MLKLTLKLLNPMLAKSTLSKENQYFSSQVTRVLPTLLFTEFTAKAPKIVVDMGAIPYVCKGATVMAPGIVRVEGEFGKGDLVLIVDMKHGKALALRRKPT